MHSTLQILKTWISPLVLTLFVYSCDFTVRDWNELTQQGEKIYASGDDEPFSGKVEVVWQDSTGTTTEIGTIHDGYKVGVWKFVNAAGDTIMREIYGDYGKLERCETTDGDFLVYTFPYSSDGEIDKKEFYRNDSLVRTIEYNRLNGVVFDYTFTYWDKKYQKFMDTNNEIFAEGAFYNNQKQGVWKEGVRYNNFYDDDDSKTYSEMATLYTMTGEYKDGVKQGVWTLYNKGKQVSEVYGNNPPIFAKVTYKDDQKHGTTKVNLSLGDVRIDEAITIIYNNNSIASYSFSDSLISALRNFKFQQDREEEVQSLLEMMQACSAPSNYNYLDLKLIDVNCFEATECTFKFQDVDGKTLEFDWELIPWMAQEGSYEKAFLQKFGQNHKNLIGYTFRVYYSSEIDNPGICEETEEGMTGCTPIINMELIQNKVMLDWYELGCVDVNHCQGASWYNQEEYGILGIGTKKDGLNDGLWFEFSPNGAFAIGKFSIEKNRQDKKEGWKNWYWKTHHVNMDTEGGRFSEGAKSGNWYYKYSDGRSYTQYFSGGANRTNYHNKTEAEARRNTRLHGTPSGGMLDAMNRISDPTYCSLCRGTGRERSMTGSGSRRCPMCDGKGRRSY